MMYHPYLKSICGSVESEADPQFGQRINFALVKFFPGYATGYCKSTFTQYIVKKEIEHKRKGKSMMPMCLLQLTKT